MNDQTYNALVNGWKEARPAWDEMDLDQRLRLEQVKLLRSINGKLNFFAVLAVLAIIASFLSGL